MEDETKIHLCIRFQLGLHSRIITKTAIAYLCICCQLGKPFRNTRTKAHMHLCICFQISRLFVPQQYDSPTYILIGEVLYSDVKICLGIFKKSSD